MQALLGTITALRSLVAAIENLPSDADTAYRTMVDTRKQSLNVIESVGAVVESLSTSHEAIDNRLATAEGTIGQWGQQGSSQSRKPLSESRCVGNLKILGSDKSEFKNWNEKLINAIA